MAKTSVLFDLCSKSVILTPDEVSLWGTRPEAVQFVDALCERFASELRANPGGWNEAETKAMYRIFACVQAMLANPDSIHGGLGLASSYSAEKNFPRVKAAFEARGWEVTAYEDSEIGGWIWRFEPSLTR